jgi:hypothetical protein
LQYITDQLRVDSSIYKDLEDNIRKR